MGGRRGAARERPRRLDLAWHSTETNEIGLDEFANWLKKVDSELMYAVNLGTRGIQEALDVLEYANIRSGTKLSDERISNGVAEPHNIRMWCLGNEMDGQWQLGHSTPLEYGQLAVKTARAMRQLDPALVVRSAWVWKPTQPARCDAPLFFVDGLGRASCSERG